VTVFPPARKMFASDNPGSLGRLLRGGGIALGINVAAIGIRYLLNVFLARWLGAGGYGGYVYTISWVQVLAIPATVGLGAAAIRFVPGYLHDQNWGALRGFLVFGRRVCGLTGVFLAGLAVAGVGLLAPPATQTRLLMAGMALVPFLALVTFQGQFLRGAGRITHALGSMNFVPPAVALILVTGMWVRGALSALHAVLAMGGALGLSVLLQGVLARRVVPKSGRRATAVIRGRKWLSVSLPMLLTNAFSTVLARTDVLVVGTIVGSTGAGLYGAAAKTAALVGFFLVAVNAIAAPDIASLFKQGDMQGLRRLATRVSWLTFVPSAAVAVGLFVLRAPVLGIFGAGFDRAAGVLAVLLLGNLANALMGPVGYLLTLTGHERMTAGIYGMTALLNAAASVFLTARFGIMGAAVATAISLAVWNLSCLVGVRRTLGLRYVPLGRLSR